MRRGFKTVLLAAFLTLAVPQVPRSEAAVPAAVLEAIRLGVKKVIVAIDLKIQRMQNRTIWLQNAQQVLENALNKLKLEEIAEWSQRQKDLYGDYYRGLWKVRSLIGQYQRVKDIAVMQGQLVAEYREAWGILSGNGNFSAKELRWMEKVYLGILDRSVDNLDQLSGVVSAFNVQMSDGERLETIHRVEKKVRTNLYDLRRFNERNFIINRQRDHAKGHTGTLRQLHE